MKTWSGMVACLLIVSMVVGVRTFDAQEGAEKSAKILSPFPTGTIQVMNQPYVEGGGTAQMLDLVVPGGTGPYPLLIFIHGGAWQKGSKDGAHALEIRALQQDFAMASLNYRFTDVASFPAQLEDVKAAVRWLRSHAAQYHLDSKRFGGWGFSAGGELVGLLATTGDSSVFDKPGMVSTQLQAAATFAGPSNMTMQGAGWKDTDVNKKPLQDFLGGKVQDKQDVAKMASPFYFVRPNLPPMIIFQGEKDMAVPYQQAIAFADELKKNHDDVTLVLVPEATHQTISSPENQRQAFEFFKRTLQAAHLSGTF